MGQDDFKFGNLFFFFYFANGLALKTVHNRRFSEFDPLKTKKDHPETREQGGLITVRSGGVQVN